MIIKSIPEDFVVEEALDVCLEDQGEYTLFSMTKRGFNTEDAILLLSRHSGIERKHFGFAGRKDKHALTTQFFSVPTLVAYRLQSLPGIELRRVGCTSQRLVLGDLRGNTFCIVVRGLSSRREIPSRFRTLNLFGEQRFGKQSANVEIGRSLVQGTFDHACLLLGLSPQGRDYIGALRAYGIRHLRFFVHAYQSFLWNIVATSLKDSSLDHLDVLGYLSDLRGEVKELYDPLLREDRIEPSHFLIRSLPEAGSEGWLRQLFLDVQLDATWSSDEKQPEQFACTVKFFLPKGSYATVVVRTLFLDL